MTARLLLTLEDGREWVTYIEKADDQVTHQDVKKAATIVWNRWRLGLLLRDKK